MIHEESRKSLADLEMYLHKLEARISSLEDENRMMRDQMAYTPQPYFRNITPIIDAPYYEVIC